MRAPPLAINDLEPPDCFSYALNSVNLTIPAEALNRARAALFLSIEEQNSAAA